MTWQVPTRVRERAGKGRELVDTRYQQWEGRRHRAVRCRGRATKGQSPGRSLGIDIPPLGKKDMIHGRPRPRVLRQGSFWSHRKPRAWPFPGWRRGKAVTVLPQGCSHDSALVPSEEEFSPGFPRLPRSSQMRLRSQTHSGTLRR